MKIKYILSMAAVISALNAGAQTEPDSIHYEDPPPVMEDVFEDYDLPAIEAVPVEPYVDYIPVNKFKYNKKIKVEEKPDKQAVYSAGTSAFLEEIRYPSLPGYGAENCYVIIQFVVGKDSLLYNPEILYSKGAQYSVNATDVIERLMSKFTPAMKNGKPVDSIITVPVHFIRRDYTSGYEDYRY